MEATLINQIISALISFLKASDLIFTIIFITLMWILNEGADNTSLRLFSWIHRISKAWRAFILGILLAFIYGFFNNMTSKADITSLIYGILLGMATWKLGINNIFEGLKKLLSKKTTIQG
jgi:chromate transport protein ChrA